MQQKKHHQGGRKPKADKAVFRYSISFNATDHEKFLKMFEESGMSYKAHFIISRVFGESFRVIKIDSNTIDYYNRLTNFYSQFRAIGINYNQIVKALNTNFSQKKALSMLYKLEKETIILANLNRQIIELTKEFEEKWLQK